MIYYKHFFGDYQAKTVHLSLVEHGVYRQMLDCFYSTSRPLPVKTSDICRLIRASERTEKKAVESVVGQFWQSMPTDFSDLFELLECDKEDDRALLGRVVTPTWFDGGLISPRAVWEMMDYTKRSETNRQIAIAREQKKREARLSLVGGDK